MIQYSSAASQRARRGWIATTLALAVLLPFASADAGQVACTPSPGFTHCLRITYLGADQSFIVPGGVTSLQVRAWGAGGGGSNNVWWPSTTGGGGGGYVQGRLAVTPGTNLTVRVGQGGITESNLPTYGGGGTGGPSLTQKIGGSGGGYSGVFNAATPILIAGAGGGGTPAGNGGNALAGGGGGLTGGNAVQDGGGGGSQVAGGAPAVSPACETQPTAGGYLTGGNGGSPGLPNHKDKENGGGGGGGYYGGGGGRCQSQNLSAVNGGGGGGSSYFGHASVSGGMTTAGSNGGAPYIGGAAGQSADDQYVAGIGVGVGTGGVGTAAGNGLVVLQWVAPTVQIAKTTIGGTGTNAFEFIHNGLTTFVNAPANSSTINVSGAGTVAGAVLSGPVLTALTITESPAPGYVTTGITCIDTNAAATGNVNPLAVSDVRGVNSISIAAAAMRGDSISGIAANIVCTFTNTADPSVSGKVFLDNGAGGAVANNGVQDGSEVAQPGIAVVLTNCSGTIYASAATDGSGNYKLAVPSSLAVGAPLCVDQTNVAGRVSTGASVGSAALPSGAATLVNGTSYTYTRTGLPDRIAFAWNGLVHPNLNFGDVESATFDTNNARSGQPGNTVAYPHTFVAQTSGTVSFSIASSVATPALAGWGEKIFTDVGCTGTLQAGATLLSPPPVSVPVTRGQRVCVIVQEFIPATALAGHRNDVAILATFHFANANPALNSTHLLADVTSVSASALELKKEVRNVTQAGSFGLNNQARSQEILEYRLTYTNNGTSPITAMNVSDATPNYTTFVSAATGTTPGTLTACQKQTPANPLPAPAVACGTVQAAGGTGHIGFQFTGSLQPGATGDVLFQVRVD